MIRKLINLALLLVVAILIYNFFFGTDEERASSKKVFGQMRGVVTSVAGVVRSERDKFDAGKYDKVMDKLGDAYKTVRDKAQYVDGKVLQRLGDLEQRKAELEKEIDSIEAEPAPTPEPTSTKKGLKKSTRDEELKASKEADLKARKAELQREMEQLIKDSEQMLQEAEQE
jgi:type II secretory pathway component PulM